MTTRSIEIDGMNGDVCIKRVNAALRQVNGVSVQSVDVGTAVLDCDDEKAYEAACDAINNAGYDAHAAIGASAESSIHQERMNLVRPKGDSSSSSQRSSQSPQSSSSQGSQQSKGSQMSQGHPSRFTGNDGYTAAQESLSQSKAGATSPQNAGSKQGSNPNPNADISGSNKSVTESNRSTPRQSGSSAVSEPTWEDQPVSTSQANQRDTSRSQSSTARPGDNAPDSGRKGGRPFDSKVDEDADAPPAGTTNRSARKD